MPDPIVMTRELRDRWTTALRSGDYKQAHQALCAKGDDGELLYCCLGVFADVLGMEFVADEDFGIVIDWNEDDWGDEHPVYSSENLGELIVGFPVTKAESDEDEYTQANAWKRNDDRGWSFGEIADWLDRWDLPSEAEVS